MAKTNSGVVSYAKAQVGKPYWFGTHGQVATEALYNSKKKQYPSYYTASDFKSQFGKKVHDCSGLIKGYLMDGSYVSKYDINAAMMYAKGTSKGTISSFPKKNGQLVFKGSTVSKINHVGVYCTDGYVYEAKGHAYGVVKTKFVASQWQYWAQSHFLTDDSKTSSNSSSGATTSKPSTPATSTGTYTVKKGDTLTAIAKKYNTTVDNLVKLNGIKDKNKISVGQKLKVTGSTTNTTGYPKTGVVNTNTKGLNLRKTASTKGAVLTSIPKGKTITLTSKSGNFYKTTYGGVTGYVSADWVRII